MPSSATGERSPWVHRPSWVVIASRILQLLLYFGGQRVEGIYKVISTV